MENMFDEVPCVNIKTFSYKEGELSLFADILQRGDKYEVLMQKGTAKPEIQEHAFLSNALETFKWFVIENVPFLEENERNNNCQH